MRNNDELRLGVPATGELAGEDYLTILYFQRRIIFATVFFFLLLAIVTRFIIPAQYEAQIVMVPTPSDDSLQASMNGALGGLSLLTGTSPGGEQKDVAVATLQGRAFLENFIRAENLMPVLFASEWDSKIRNWKSSNPPTLEDGYSKLVSAMTIDASPTASIVRLRVRWRDAVMASAIANDLIRKLNSQFQSKAINEADRMIDNLTASYPQTSIAEVRTSVANLIQEQIKQRILAKSRSEYAMTIVDPAEPSTKKINPGLLILLPLGLFLGLVVGIPAAFLAQKKNIRWPRLIAPLLAPRN